MRRCVPVDLALAYHQDLVIYIYPYQCPRVQQVVVQTYKSYKRNRKGNEVNSEIYA